MIFKQPRVHFIVYLFSHLILRTHPQPLHSDANEPGEGEVDEGARGPGCPGPSIHETVIASWFNKTLLYQIKHCSSLHLYVHIPLGSNNLDKMRLSPVRSPLTCLMWTSPFSVGSNCEWYDVQTTSSSYSWSSGLPTFGSTPDACQHSSSETAKNCAIWNSPNLWSRILHGTRAV